MGEAFLPVCFMVDPVGFFSEGSRPLDGSEGIFCKSRCLVTFFFADHFQKFCIGEAEEVFNADVKGNFALNCSFCEKL